MAYILVVEDEQSINELIVWNLRLVGHSMDFCFDGRTALAMLRRNKYDLILLDVMLPEQDGFSVMEQSDGETPIIFVTAKDSLPDRLKGLNLGADDYIVKPFEMLELIARVEAVLRRTRTGTKIFSLGDVSVEMENRLVRRNGREIELTPREFSLLEVLILNRNLALSRDKLLELVWGYDYDGEERTVDVHIQRLRKKLGWENVIETVYKYGYRLSEH